MARTEYKKVTAIIRADRLPEIEQALHAHGVRGASISLLRGYGEATNLFQDDWLEDRARIEIFTTPDNTNAMVEIIMNAAHVGLAGDGIVAVEPVECLYRIRTKQAAREEEL